MQTQQNFVATRVLLYFLPPTSFMGTSPNHFHSGTPALRHLALHLFPTPKLLYMGTSPSTLSDFHSGTPALRHSGTSHSIYISYPQVLGTSPSTLSDFHSGTPALRHSALRHSSVVIGAAVEVLL